MLAPAVKIPSVIGACRRKAAHDARCGGPHQLFGHADSRPAFDIDSLDIPPRRSAPTRPTAIPGFLDIQYFRLRLFSVLHEDDRDFTRVDWEDGMLLALPDMMWSQPFNSGAAAPARYLAVALGRIALSILQPQRTRYSLTSSRSVVRACAMDRLFSRRTEKSTLLYGVTIGKGGTTHEIRIHS